MKVLLDTHVLLWWLRDDPRLGPRARTLIADPRNAVLVSIASFWEIAIKARLGKLDASASALIAAAEDGGFAVLAVGQGHLARLETLVSQPGHNDPFDHLILAQALAEDARLMTSDSKLLAYDFAALRTS